MSVILFVPGEFIDGAGGVCYTLDKMISWLKRNEVVRISFIAGLSSAAWRERRFMQKDITEKRLEDCNDVFADIYNGLVFEGKKVLDPELLVPLPTESFTRKSNGSIRQGNRDICKADQRMGRYRLICCMEN